MAVAKRRGKVELCASLSRAWIAPACTLRRPDCIDTETCLHVYSKEAPLVIAGGAGCRSNHRNIESGQTPDNLAPTQFSPAKAGRAEAGRRNRASLHWVAKSFVGAKALKQLQSQCEGHARALQAGHMRAAGAGSLAHEAQSACMRITAQAPCCAVTGARTAARGAQRSHSARAAVQQRHLQGAAADRPAPWGSPRQGQSHAGGAIVSSPQRGGGVSCAGA